MDTFPLANRNATRSGRSEEASARRAGGPRRGRLGGPWARPAALPLDL